MPEPVQYFVIVAIREGAASLQSLDAEAFAAMRRSWIDEGFTNMQTEWYESGDAPMPDLISVFAYWEDPEDAPTLDQLEAWGRMGTDLDVERLDRF